MLPELTKDRSAGDQGPDTLLMDDRKANERARPPMEERLRTERDDRTREDPSNPRVDAAPAKLLKAPLWCDEKGEPSDEREDKI